MTPIASSLHSEIGTAAVAAVEEGATLGIDFRRHALAGEELQRVGSQSIGGSRELQPYLAPAKWIRLVSEDWVRLPKVFGVELKAQAHAFVRLADPEGVADVAVSLGEPRHPSPLLHAAEAIDAGCRILGEGAQMPR